MMYEDTLHRIPTVCRHEQRIYNIHSYEYIQLLHQIMNILHKDPLVFKKEVLKKAAESKVLQSVIVYVKGGKK